MVTFRPRLGHPVRKISLGKPLLLLACISLSLSLSLSLSSLSLSFKGKKRPLLKSFKA
jgi:hypothetical protein